jgi:hypothetical protein
VFLPLAGLIARAPGDYWYLHRSLDKLPPPEQLYADGPLVLEQDLADGPARLRVRGGARARTEIE